MPSSLMARARATQPRSSKSSKRPAPGRAVEGKGSGGGSGGGGSSSSSGRYSRTVTPPPQAQAKPASSLAAASSSSLAVASSSLGRARQVSYDASDNKGGGTTGYVPSFRRNPLNAAAASGAVGVGVAADAGTASDKASEAAKSDSAAKIPDAAELPAASNVPASHEPAPTPANAPLSEPKPPPTKTLLQQLLAHPMPCPSIPSPYKMCSQTEAEDRREHMELSPFEHTIGSSAESGAISTVKSAASPAHAKPPASRWGDDSDSDDDNGNDNNMGMGGGFSGESRKFGRAARDRPDYNPRYVVKKYRRSAAGGGTLSEASERDPRTLDQLECTVDYLLRWIFAGQLPPLLDDAGGVRNGGTNGGGGNVDPNEISIWGEETPVKKKPTQQQNGCEQEGRSPFSLSDAVSFVDDRLRAVQKDLVTLLGNLEQPSTASNDSSATAKRERIKHIRTKQTVRRMQAKMVRYNILSSYLLSEVTGSKYEAKFGARALRTALACYLNLSTTIRDDYKLACDTSNGSASDGNNIQREKEMRVQDEIMAYAALLHSSAVLRSEEQALPPPASSEITSSLMEDSGSGWGAILNSGPCSSGDGRVGNYPRWRWALELAAAVQEGNYQRYFNLLEDGPSIPPHGTSDETSTAEAEADNARFLVLARCCASHSLNIARLGQLRRYNHAFGKNEKVPSENLARLLRFGASGDDGKERAIEFCRDAGLPMVEKEVGEEKKMFVTMKAGPISVKGEEAIRRMCKPGRTNDAFVFGSKLDDVDGNSTDGVESLTDKLARQCDVGQDVDDWEEREEYGDDRDEKTTVGTAGGPARTDEDGVVIPSSGIIRNLIG